MSEAAWNKNSFPSVRSKSRVFSLFSPGTGEARGKSMPCAWTFVLNGVGSLHAHVRVFIQCIHQHTPLEVIFEKIKNDGRSFVVNFLRYKSHVRRQVYATTDTWNAGDGEVVENAWPEYKENVSLTSSAKY